MRDEGGHVARFIAEAREHLAVVGDALITLERHPDDRAACIERLLRGTHSLKGGAGIMGKKQIERLAHAMETATENLRDGRVAVDAAAIDALLFAADRINAMVDDVEHSEEADLSEPLQALAPLLKSAPLPGPLAMEQSLRSTGRVQELRLDTADYAMMVQGQPAIPPNHSLYGIRFDWHVSEQQWGLSPIVIAERLEKAGTLVGSRLEWGGGSLRDTMPQPPVAYRAVIASELGPEEFARRVGIPNAEIARLENVPNGPRQAPRAPKTDTPANRGATSPTSLRVSVSLIDQMMELASELALVRNEALRTTGRETPAIRGLVRRLDAVTSDLQGAALQMRMQPIGTLFDRFPRLVRDVARQLGKKIEIVITGSAVELDKTVLDVLSDPLTHLVRNCCDHGIELPDQRRRVGKTETGTLRLSARQERGQIIIDIRDDGKGIDTEAVKRKALEHGLKSREELERLSTRQACELILMSGLSTAHEVTDLSGRGVGMDIVKTNLEQIGGLVEIESTPGQGTTFSLRLPLTLAIMPCLLIGSEGQRYAVPQRDVEEILRLSDASAARIECTHDGESLRLRDSLLPVVRLSETFQRRQPLDDRAWRDIVARHHGEGREKHPTTGYAAVVRAGSRRFVLVFDEVLENEDIVVKPLVTLLRPLSIYAACAILGDGGVVMILSTEGIARHSGVFQKAADATPVLDRTTGDSAPFLLATFGRDELVAIPLASVRAIMRVARESFQVTAGRKFVHLNGETLNVVGIQELLQLGNHEPQPYSYLVVPRNAETPVGFIVSDVVDTVLLTEPVDQNTLAVDGVTGTTVVNGRIALVPDLARMAAIWHQAANSTQGALPAAQRSKILLVEDTQFFRTLVGNALNEAGYTVVLAANGSEGLAALEQESFDLVVSDIEMPVMDGHAFARALRADARWKALPLLALTTLGGPAHQEASHASGFNAHETKFDRAHFLAVVKKLLDESANGVLSAEVSHD